VDGRPECAIVGSYTEFIRWRAEDPKGRARVTFLNTAERAEQLVANGAAKGALYRIGTWETSPARAAAAELERLAGELEG
jgi:hypothetical protein